MKDSVYGAAMGQQLLEAAVFGKQSFRVGEKGKKGIAADDHKFFPGPGHGYIEAVGAV